MSFFKDTFVREILSSHIEEISSLEDSEARELLKRYSQIRSELRDRLDSLKGDSFTAQKLRVTLIQVDTALNAMSKSMSKSLKESSVVISKKGTEHLIKEAEKFSYHFEGSSFPISIDSVLIANNIEELLVSRHESSLMSYSHSTRSLISRSLTNAVIENASVAETNIRLSRFLAGEEWRLSRLARTEFHHIYNMSKQKTLEKASKTNKKLQKALYHRIDGRTGEDSRQAKSKNLIVDIDKPFKYTFTRKLKSGEIVKDHRVFMVPPDRPNDRSIMIPYSKGWE